MKVLKWGKTVSFVCAACDSIFIAGIHSTKTTTGENYYAQCPVCGAECIADAADIQKLKRSDSFKEIEGNFICTDDNEVSYE